MQRSYYSLAQGKFKESAKFNPGAIPFALLIVFTMFHLRYKFKYGHYIIIAGFVLTATLMWLNFLLKLWGGLAIK
jgi:hypothetical protein